MKYANNLHGANKYDDWSVANPDHFWGLGRIYFLIPTPGTPLCLAMVKNVSAREIYKANIFDPILILYQ